MLKNKTRNFVIFTSVITALAISPLSVAQTHYSQPENIEKISSTLDAWRSDDAPGVAIAMSVDGNVIFKDGVGVGNLEYDSMITPDTPFQVASISKQFTAFSIAILATEGKLNLDDDIRIYLPKLAPTPRIVTIRHLLNHTGGYREVNSLNFMGGDLTDSIRTKEQSVAILNRQRGVNFPAGERVEYSNSGYFLLSQIVETVSGQSFYDFTKTRIFEPLNMHNSRFVKSRHDIIKGRALAYNSTQDGYETVLLNNESPGSSGLVTTAMDLLKWADNFTDQKIGNQAIFNIMAERGKADNGEAAILAKGQELRPYRGLQTWSHGGRDGAYRSFILRIPSKRFALSITSNRSDFDTAKLAFKLLDIVFADDPDFEAVETPQWEKASPELIRRYAGDYRLFAGLIFTLTADEGELYFAPLNSGKGHAIEQIGEHEFMLTPSQDISLKFILPENGQATAFDYTIGLHGAIPAKRIALAKFDSADIDLQDYTGVIISPELGIRFELSIEDDQLVARNPTVSPISFSPYQNDTFKSDSDTIRKIEFIRDESGVITSCLTSSLLADDLICEFTHKTVKE